MTLNRMREAMGSKEEEATNTRQKREEARGRALMFYSLNLLSLAGIWTAELIGSSTLHLMDLEGWVFFVASCLTHAALLQLPILLAALLLARLSKKPDLVALVQCIPTGLLTAFVVLDHQVYAIYRFHINGFVMSMLTGPGAGQIFEFDPAIVMKETGMLVLACHIPVVLMFATRLLWRKTTFRLRPKMLLCTLAACIAASQVLHIYGSFAGHTATIQTARMLPYYAPLSANKLMTKLGFDPGNRLDASPLAKMYSGLAYPRRSLETTTPAELPDIVLITIDAWSRRALTPETMPNLAAWARKSDHYRGHLSGSNGTRSGIFSLFYSLPCTYWESFAEARMTPVFLDRLQELGYELETYPSATLLNPNFRDEIFGKWQIRCKTEGETSYERDSALTCDCIAALRMAEAGGGSRRRKPKFRWLFYDNTHATRLRKELNHPYPTRWTAPDYTALSNTADPAPFFNLYRNCAWHVDSLIGHVLAAIDTAKTLVIITGDHAQEFNENKKNYWGHNSNFSRWQIGVPLLVRHPGQTEGRTLDHRTTHYDIWPTVMREYLGVKNPYEDYSMGHDLADTTPRDWHIVGSSLNYAFLAQGDTIIEKANDGRIEVHDKDMNLVEGYRVPGDKLRLAIEKMNSFYSKAE